MLSKIELHRIKNGFLIMGYVDDAVKSVVYAAKQKDILPIVEKAVAKLDELGSVVEPMGEPPQPPPALKQSAQTNDDEDVLG